MPCRGSEGNGDIVQLRRQISYDLFSNISIQSFVDGRPMIGKIVPRPSDARQNAPTRTLVRRNKIRLYQV